MIIADKKNDAQKLLTNRIPQIIYTTNTLS